MQGNGTPTIEQARLQLQLYEQRREAKLREARDWFLRSFFAQNLEDVNRLAPAGSQEAIFLGMVLGYWEQTCSLLNYGLLHEDLFFEVTTPEFYGVWERVKDVLPALRQQLFRNPNLLTHLEKAAQRYERWLEPRAPEAIEALRQRFAQARAVDAGR